jgi:hypothetical protein
MKKKIVRTKLLFVLLFSIAIFLQIASAVVLRTNPNASIVLSALSIVAWLSSCAFTALPLIKVVQHGVPKLWTKMYARMHIGKRFASQDQLKLLQQNINRLGFAMYGTTPELERGRRTHFTMLGEAVPDLILPPQNAVLYAEFKSLTKFLNHCGFPRPESVRLQDLDFARQWGRSLEARLQQTQKDYAAQQQQVQWYLQVLWKTLADIRSEYPKVEGDSGYERIRGALKLLDKITLPPKEMLEYLAALLQDMERLRKQFKELVA